MCLIFDRFPNRSKALAFAAHVEGVFKKRADVFDNRADSEPASNEALLDCRNPDGRLCDLFPCRLDEPIVLVERDDEENVERKICKSVKRFGGEFAGT